jgi:hypothetical protein
MWPHTSMRSFAILAVLSILHSFISVEIRLVQASRPGEPPPAEKQRPRQAATPKNSLMLTNSICVGFNFAHAGIDSVQRGSDVTELAFDAA